ncbi:MAG: hypothetical protein JW895_10370 [Thermoleophilaceae bacterium]|nr:hypothetical protein [Thermoleophilaceae bacterium]
MAPRTRIWAYGACGVLVVAGAICSALIDGLTGDVLLIGLEMLGLGGILLLVFLEIGLSEDRDRERGRR